MEKETPTSATWGLLHDAARCLAVGHRLDLRLNPQAYLQPTTLKKLVGVCQLGHTSGAAYAEADVPALSFLVRLLWSAELLTRKHDRLEPAPAALRWLQSPLPEQLGWLRRTWWAMAFKADAMPALGWPTYLARRWPRVLLETCRWVLEDTTLTSAALTATLKARGCYDPPGNAGHFPHIQQDTAQRVRRLASFILTVPLRSLGIVRLEGGDSHYTVHPTGEGRAWLRAAFHQRAQAPVDAAVEVVFPPVELAPPAMTAPPVSVEADLHFKVRPEAPAAFTYAALHFADLTALPATPEGGTRYHLTRESLRRGAVYGYPAAEVAFWLGRASWGELPPAALDQLRAWAKEITTLAYEPGYRVHVPPALLSQLQRRKPFRQRAQPLQSGDAVWVSAADAPALWRYLRRQGYTPVTTSPPVEHPLPPLARAQLPLQALAVALGTYRALRRYVPGLADLGLARLWHDLDAALSQEARVGVAALLATHVAALRRALGQEEDANTPPDWQPVIAAAIAAQSPLRLTYVDTQAQVTHRQVTPLRLEQRGARRYLVARCALRGEERHFRLDRVIEVKREE